MATHLQHLDDVPKHDRELVDPPQIREGDDVFDTALDQWVTVDRVVVGGGLQAFNSLWRLEQDTSGKWTFHHSFMDTGGPVTSGPVERRRR